MAARLHWIALLPVLATACGGTADRQAPIVEREGSIRCDGCNLVLISVDTLRADRLGVYGSPRPTSPAIDELASRSVVFRDVLAQTATTAPSHRSIFTGRYVFEHRGRRPGPPTLATLLAAAGYRTAAFTDGGQMIPAFRIDEGFETFVESGGVHRRGAQVGGGLRVLQPLFLDWIRGHVQEKLFAFLHTYDVHCPYTPPEPFRSMFTAGLETDLEVEGQCGGFFDTQSLDRDDFGYLSALYDGGVRYVDSRIGEILLELDRLGLMESTIIVITSDHGESLGERGDVGHRRVWDVQLKIPWILHLPGGYHRFVDQPVQSVDLLPTLLSLLGIPAPEGLSGIDLVPAIHGEEGRRDRLRFAEGIDIPESTIRLDSRWSLLLHRSQPVALFDLRSDPREESDQIGHHPEIAARLFASYQRLGPVPASGPDEAKGLSRDEVERLRSLGYLGSPGDDDR